MKLSDYVASFLARQGIRYVFAISGGASIHLIHSIADTKGIKFICPQHEQAGAMAADAYSRVSGGPGAAIATSGPGATNMLTGVCCAYYDSVPVIYITGQVTTFRLRRDSGVRQLGFQETPTTEIYKPITKYSVLINDPSRIKFELEKATYIAMNDRPGPVLIDIPDDIQRADIDPSKLDSFVPERRIHYSKQLGTQLDKCMQLLSTAKRPVIIFGWGIRIAKAEKEAKELVTNLGFPIALTWAVMDLFPSDFPLLVGTFGTHGSRHGNFAVQNADLIFCIGARLDTHQTGTPITDFSRGAKKVIVDIDPHELNKTKRFGMNAELLIRSDAKEFLRLVTRRTKNISLQDITDWKKRIRVWKEKFPICQPDYYKQRHVNPYCFVKILSRECREGDVFFVDTGCCLAWMMQAFEFKAKQRLFHDFNNTAMGYALPASIGACFALNGRSVICVTGDGSLQMNIQELATVIRHNLPVKIFLINNHGYSMIQQTQDQWLGARYLASTVEGGLAFPDFIKVAKVYGFKTVNISINKDLSVGIKKVFKMKGAVFCNVEILPEHRIIPQVRFGRPIEDGDPLLQRKKFLEQMVVKPTRVSLQH